MRYTKGLMAAPIGGWTDGWVETGNTLLQTPALLSSIPAVTEQETMECGREQPSTPPQTV